MTGRATVAPPKRTRLDHDERRASILAAARQIFCERPLAEVSMAEIAEEAGVARGLLHHYFGAKRDLYLAVVRDVTHIPAVPLPAADRDQAEMWEQSVDGWMRMMESNRVLWLTALAAGGTGHDPEVEAILNEARELVAVRALTALGVDQRMVTPEALALTRGYGGFAEEIIREWLQRDRLSREQARTALVRVLPMLVGEVLDDVRRAGVSRPAGARPSPSTAARRG